MVILSALLLNVGENQNELVKMSRVKLVNPLSCVG